MASNTPDTLVKFCSADTAKQILSSQTLRWSAPNLFNDPFELHHESQLNFDPHSLLDAAIKLAISMIFGVDEPTGNTPLINAIRRWRDEERFASPEEAGEVMGDLLSQVVDGRQQVIEHMMTQWRKYARNLRICSFCEKADNLTAWQYYADQHRGIAIKFLAGEYTDLKKPEKVLYKPVRPEITTLNDEINVIMRGGRYVAQEHFLEKFTTKPPFSANEKEWRCFFNAPEQLGEESQSPNNWFENKRFERNEVSAIYFGAFTPVAEKRAILELVQNKYNQAKVFQSKVVSNKYDIEFERVGKKS